MAMAIGPDDGRAEVFEHTMGVLPPHRRQYVLEACAVPLPLDQTAENMARAVIEWCTGKDTLAIDQTRFAQAYQALLDEFDRELGYQPDLLSRLTRIQPAWIFAVYDDTLVLHKGHAAAQRDTCKRL
jgi:hypothetical protein